MDIEWGNLSFGYYKTDYNVRCYYKNGTWGELEVSSSEYVPMHIAATALHYGQEAFEGLKAFKGKDGRVRIFRWDENWKRLNNSAEGVMMPTISKELFEEAIKKVIKLNEKFVPPYGTGASLYLRPLLIGTGAQVGVKPAVEYCLIIFATPVGPYFKQGFKPVKVQLVRDFDRAAPLGTGHIKIGGNYAASLRASERSHAEGYSTVLFLDAKEKKYIDEAGPANFFGIKNNTYITPDSHSILPSITNMSLRTIAEELGLKVERRQIPAEELGTFEEAGACGTAAVISPIGEIFDRNNNTSFIISKDGNPGPISTKMHERLLAIQYGDYEDKYGWIDFI
jgi:branched-chain amino acid aminotransferase